MGVTHHGDGTTDPREQGGAEGAHPVNENQKQHRPFSETLETYIGQLERFAARSDRNSWERSVIGLRRAAQGIGAKRITTTASLLLAADISDGIAVRELLDRLRSDGRIFTLDEVCRKREEALAAELSSLAPGSEQDPA